MTQDYEFTGKIKALNVFFTILVVYIHAYNAPAYGLQYQINFGGVVLCLEDIISQMLAHIAVPVFFFISGFLFFLKCTKDNLFSKIMKRGRTLLVPYLIWNFIYFILFAIVGNIPIISEHLNSVSGTISLNKLLASVLFYKCNYIMWYIYQLLIYVLLAPIIYQVIKSKIVTVISLTILFLLYSLGFLEIPKLSSVSIANGLYPDMLFYFLCGAWLGYKKPYLKTDRSNVLSLCFLGLGLFIWIINRVGFKEWMLDVGNISFIFLAIISIVLYCPKRSYRMVERFVDFLKPHTFIIFVLHPFVIECFQKIFFIMIPHNPICAMIDYIFSPLLTIFTCICVSLILRKASLSFYGMLVGGRV